MQKPFMVYCEGNEKAKPFRVVCVCVCLCVCVCGTTQLPCYSTPPSPNPDLIFKKPNIGDLSAVGVH